jgi:hypothetical protein
MEKSGAVRPASDSGLQPDTDEEWFSGSWKDAGLRSNLGVRHLNGAFPASVRTKGNDDEFIRCRGRTTSPGRKAASG